MKKIDKLVLESFIGPFIITFLVVVFILLNINMIKYFDDIVGKGLDWDVIGQLFFYFAIFTIPTAMPLAVLLSSLIAFGNLGEHFELTAIKSAGISLVRILRPIFFFVIFLTALAFWANNNLVPKAALEAYSLLYDIKQKKPAMELQEGTFYDGIPGISIKVDKKFADGQTFNNVVIYDHRKNDGNKEVTVADSGRMYTILNDQYMKLELFNGFNYTEGASNEREMTGQRGNNNESLTRSKFAKTQIVFDLASFQLERTDKKWFQGNRIMRNLGELNGDIDSLKDQISQQRLVYYQGLSTYFTYLRKNETIEIPKELRSFQLKRDSFYQRRYNKQGTPSELATAKNDSIAKAMTKTSPERTNDSVIKTPVLPDPDSLRIKKQLAKQERIKTREKLSNLKPKAGSTKADIKNKKKTSPKPVVAKKIVLSDSMRMVKLDSVFNSEPGHEVIQNAANMARQIKSQIANTTNQEDMFQTELRVYIIQWYKIFASSLACIAMFLIGAPLGAIIKKGGLGMPFLVSILFFIVYYVLTMQGEKLAKQDLNIPVGIFAADFILLLAGLIFLRQARIDARLFEMDFYAVLVDKFKKWRKSRSKAAPTTI
jgi:lipopolysaccharide export system permease protein